LADAVASLKYYRAVVSLLWAPQKKKQQLILSS